jgi:hypothetical protein
MREVGRENDAGAVLRDHLHQALKKLAPGERIEAGNGLVEDEQLRALRHCEREREQGALAAGELTGLLVGSSPSCSIRASASASSQLGFIQVPKRR